MAARNIRPRLLDILENISIVKGAVSGRDYESFVRDHILRLAIERAIEIVSEAVRHVPVEARDKYPQVPWRNIMAIGNKLRHEYQRVDVDIVWEIAQRHLPGLEPAIMEILKSESDTEGHPT